MITVVDITAIIFYEDSWEYTCYPHIVDALSMFKCIGPSNK